MPRPLRPCLRSPWQSFQIVPRRTIHNTPRSLFKIYYEGGIPLAERLFDTSLPSPDRFARRTVHPTGHDATKDVLSVQEFVRRAGKGEAGVPEATAILEASYASLRLLPLKERRDKAAAAGASQILRWLLGTDPKLWDVTITRELVEPLCWHLEAEGRSDAVQTWLEIWANDASLRHNAVKAPLYKQAQEWESRPNARSRWTGTVLNGMVGAKISWSPNDVGPALTLMTSVYDAARDHVFFGYALTALMKAIPLVDTLPCEPRLFSRLQEMVRDQVRSPIHRDSYLDALLLAHPVSPDPQGILRFVQNEQHITAALCWKSEARQSMSHRVLKAAYICYLRGERDNATCLKDWSIKLHPRPFEQCAFLCWNYRKDPKLQDLHKHAARIRVNYKTFAEDMAA